MRSGLPPLINARVPAQSPPWKDMMESLKHNELAHQASIGQQREILRYVTTLHEWLQSNVQELQFELINLSDSVKQLRREALLQRSSAQYTPPPPPPPPLMPSPMVPTPGSMYSATPEI